MAASGGTLEADGCPASIEAFFHERDGVSAMWRPGRSAYPGKGHALPALSKPGPDAGRGRGRRFLVEFRQRLGIGHRRRPAQLASALGNRQFPGQPDGFHTAIYALFGLVAFLIALIGAVLVAWQLRPLIHPKPSPIALELQQSLHDLESATSDESRLEAARKIVRLGPDTVKDALERSTSQPMVHALAEVGPEAVDALRQALASPSATAAPRPPMCCASWVRGAGGEGCPDRQLGRQERPRAMVRRRGPGQHGARGGLRGPALIPLLEHSDPLTRRLAVVALGQIGPSAKQAAPALTKAQDHDQDEAVRKAAHDALYQVHLVETAEQRRVETISQVRELIDKLRSGDEDAAVGAANTLSESDPIASDAIPELALALQNKTNTRGFGQRRPRPWAASAARPATCSPPCTPRPTTPSPRSAPRRGKPWTKSKASNACYKPVTRPRKDADYNIYGGALTDMTTRPQILTIEDDAAIRRGIVDALRFAGYDVLEAARGRQGLDMALGAAVRPVAAGPRAAGMRRPGNPAASPPAAAHHAGDHPHRPRR